MSLSSIPIPTELLPFGPRVAAAWRVAVRYPHLSSLVRRELTRSSNTQELFDNIHFNVNHYRAPVAQVAEEAVPEATTLSSYLPSFEAAPAVSESLEAASLVAPEIALPLLAGAAAIYSGYKLYKMVKGNKKNMKPNFSLPIINKLPVETGKRIAGLVKKKRAIPVAVGETVAGAVFKETKISDGVRASGREVLGFTQPASSATAFTLVGAFNISPLAYPTSRLGILCKAHQKYIVRAWNVRVVTSSPTSADGHVLLYIHGNRHDPMVRWTANNFLPLTLSTPHAELAPRWLDAKANSAFPQKILECSFPTGDGQMDLGAGDVFVFMKSSTALASAVVMVDYVVDFIKPQVITRSLQVPIARAQWTNISIGSTQSVTKDSSVALLFTRGNDLSGNASTFPTGNAVGDVYKCVIDVTHSTFNTGAANTIWDYQVPDTSAVSLVDGYTVYLVVDGATGTYRVFPTLSTARSYTNWFRAGLTATLDFTLQTWVCLVDSIEGTLTQVGN